MKIKDIFNRRITDYYNNEYYLCSTVHDNWIDIKNRQIWIHGVGDIDPVYNDGQEPGVEYQMSNKVIKNLQLLLSFSRKDPVTVHLHCCGGMVEEGMAIYDTIKAMPYKTRIISYTHARSMSSVILQAGDERLLLPNSCFMYHDGELFVGGTQKQVYSFVDFNKRYYDKVIMDIYVDTLKNRGNSKFKNKSRKAIEEMLRDNMDKKEDVYLTSQEAVDWGFADGIFDNF